MRQQCAGVFPTFSKVNCGKAPTRDFMDVCVCVPVGDCLYHFSLEMFLGRGVLVDRKQ